MSSNVLNTNSLCLICNGSCITSRNSIHIFKEETITCSEKPLVAILSRVLDKDITEESVHSKLMCKKCFKSFDELDDLEMRYNEIKGELLRNYKLSFQKHNSENVDLKGKHENSPGKMKIMVKQNLSSVSVSKKKMIPVKNSLKTQGSNKQNLPTIEDIDEELFQIQREKDDNEIQEQSDHSEAEFIELNEHHEIIDTGALEHSSDSDYEPTYVQGVMEGQHENNLENQVDFDKTDDSRKNSVENLKVVKEEYDIIVSKDGNDYTCLICDSEPFVGDRKTIITHIKTLHNLRLYICDVCGLDFRKRNELSAHLDEHVEMEEGDFQCEICNRIFSNLRLFRIHKRMHAPQHKAWECQECGKKYSSKNLLDEHRNMHSGVRPYVCEKCGKDFASKYTFKAHEKTHEARPRPYLCGQCPKTFLSQQNLSQHERTHLGIKEYSCHLCGKQFGSAHNLEVHSIVHTGYKPFGCSLCGKAFARKAEIRDHERTHTGERPFQCEFCGARFSQRSNLQSHKRATHYDDKRHKCDECGKAFKRKRLLDYHLKAAHTGERPFKCNVCEATFVYPEHFKKHRRIHTGEKPFMCEVCGKAFNSRDNRNAHRFIHSDKKPYECLVCGAGFMRKPLLYSHMQSQGHLNDTIVVNQPRLSRVAYFREDLGINLHHWHWHLVYPFEGPREVVNKNRRGELFYYMHQQVIARYNFERLCNYLKRTERLLNLREPIKEAYFPKLDSLVASRSYPARVANQSISNLNREVDQIHQDIDDMERWRDRIFAAIHQGYIETESGERITLTENEGIDILGNMMESSNLSPNRTFYGDYHNMGHIFLSYIHDPDHRHLESFGVIGDSTTAMRDPIFYRWHAHIDDIFQEFKATIPSYPVDQLAYQGVTVSNIEIQSQGSPNNMINTFWQQSDVDLSRGMDFQPRGPVFVRFTHLQHQDFNFRITVNNQGGSRMGTCRIFMAPKFDERGNPWLFRDQKTMFIELDKFPVNLRSGQNTITRSSTQSSVTIPFERTFRDWDTNRPEGGDALAQFNFCGCGWPHHMLIPKGTAEGYQCQLFVMISNYANDHIEQDVVGTCNDAYSFCGLKDRLYPDRRSMGYPFDRTPREGVRTLQQFLTPNMRVQDVVIQFNNRTVRPRSNN